MDTQAQRNFQAGDIVSYGGQIGEVQSTERQSAFGIGVHFKGDEKYTYFTNDGRINDKHTVPLLSLVTAVEDRLVVPKTMYSPVVSSDGQSWVDSSLCESSNAAINKKIFRMSAQGHIKANGYVEVKVFMYEPI